MPRDLIAGWVSNGSIQRRKVTLSIFNESERLEARTLLTSTVTISSSSPYNSVPENDSFGNVTSADDPTTGTANDGDLPGLEGVGNEYSSQRSFTGREPDPATGLIYYRARWYDPKLGRFISEDPIGFAAGDANLSRYVGNSSPNAVDPSGLMTSHWHTVITQDALANTGLSKHAISVVVFWSVQQDAGLWTNTPPFSEGENHGTDPDMTGTISRIREFLDNARKTDDPEVVLMNFGRAAHALQDLYSHSNYVETHGRGSQWDKVPIWQMWDCSGVPLIPIGVITCSYTWPIDGFGTVPTHGQQSKDHPYTASGSRFNNVGVPYFALTRDVATRHTLQLWNELFNDLTPEMQIAVLAFGAE